MSYKFNPFTGQLDLVKPDNFSYNEVDATLTIPSKQQMIVYKSINISGSILLYGQLVVSDFLDPVAIVDTSTSETINLNSYNIIRQTASGITTSLSNPKIGSKLTITNVSGGSNTLNITIQGTASPTIIDKESFSLIYNGTDYDFI